MQKLLVETLPSLIPGVGAAKVAQLAAVARGASAVRTAQAVTASAGATNAVLNGGDARQSAYAELTALPVGKKTVAAIAQKGGRLRWKIENEGFNRQNNSGLNLEHVYSIDPEKWQA